MDVQMITVGPVQTNCFLVRSEDSNSALIVDPGDEAEKVLARVDEMGLKVEAILVTHSHFDHIGAVSPVARETGAPVYMSEVESPVLADINSFLPSPEFGPFESYEADNTLKGGERLSLAGLEIDVLSTPGHSPGHLTYSIPEERAIFSGDVLFQGSVGRTDLPYGDWESLLDSIGMLTEKLPPETTVYPGHMGLTTLGEELQSNPFLTEMAGQ